MSSKPKKPKPFDKVKAIKRLSRGERLPHGRGGFHVTKKDRPRVKKSVDEYLEELEDDENDQDDS